jgi:hypothetical protein
MIIIIIIMMIINTSFNERKNFPEKKKDDLPFSQEIVNESLTLKELDPLMFFDKTILEKINIIVKFDKRLSQ